MPHAPCPLEHRCHTSPSQAPRQARAQAVVVLSPMPTDGPVHAGGCGVGTILRAGPSCSPRLRQQRGGCRALARAGANAPAGKQHGVPSTGSTGAAWSGGTVSCTRACRRLLSGVGACCWVRWRRSAQQAALCPSSARHASGGHRAAGRSCRARWGSHPPPPVPGAASAAITHGPPDGAASGGPGGACVGGGGRSPGSPGTRVGSQQPNKGLQATANSLRSCVAPATRRA